MPWRPPEVTTVAGALAMAWAALPPPACLATVASARAGGCDLVEKYSAIEPYAVVR